MHATAIYKFLTIRVDVTRYVKARSLIYFLNKTLEKYKISRSRVELYSFPFRKNKYSRTKLNNFSKNWFIFKFKKSWAKSCYREIFCWNRLIRRNPRNRESPDEIGRVDRYGWGCASPVEFYWEKQRKSIQLKQKWFCRFKIYIEYIIKLYHFYSMLQQ